MSKMCGTIAIVFLLLAFAGVARGADAEELYRQGIALQADQGDARPDYGKARSLLEQAAAAGSTRAMVRLGQMQLGHPEGGATRNDAAAFAMFKKAADAGSPRGMLYTASCYKNGEGTAVDLAKADALYLNAVEAAEAAIKTGKDDEALVTLGIAYSHAQGVKRDYTKAVGFFQKAADLGNREALRRLGVLYEYGDGVPKDTSKSMDCYAKAGDLGDAAAWFDLGEQFRYDNLPGHMSQAKNYLIQAALWQFTPAMNELGYLLMNGGGSGPVPEVPKDYLVAMRWFKQGADLGDAECMNGIGLMIARGYAGPVDLDKATAWYKAAADGGYAAAMYNLGVLAEDKKDFAAALDWYRKAAAKDYASAQTSIGMFYEQGTGVPRDYQEAMKWYRQAADNADESAMYSIGRLYSDGNGIPKDMKLAEQWMTKAADAGDADAQKWIATALAQVRKFPEAGVSFEPPAKWTEELPSKGETVGMWMDGATATDSKLFITVEAKVAKNLDARGAAEDWAKLWNLSAEPTATDVDGEVAWQVTVEPKPRKPVPTEAVFTSHRGYLYSLVGLAKGNDDCKDQVAQLRKSWKWIPIESTAKHLEFRDTPLEAFGGEFSIDIPLKTRCRPTKEPKRVLDLFVQDFEHNAPAFNAYIQIFDSPAARFASAEQQLADSTKAEYRMSESFEWHPIKSEYPRAITQTMKLPLDAQKGAATTFIIYSLVQLDHKRIVMIVFDIPRDDPSAVPAYEKAAQKMVESIAK